MKKNITAIILACMLCAAFILTTSCGAKTAAASGSGDNSAGGSAQDSTNSADLYGEISDIAGNMATINLAAIPDTGIPVPGGNNGGGFGGSGIQDITLDKNNLPAGVTVGSDGSISYNGTKIDGVTLNADGSLNVTDQNALRQMFADGIAGGSFGGRTRATDSNGNPVTPTDSSGNPITYGNRGSGGQNANADNGGAGGNGTGQRQYYGSNIPTDSSGNFVMPTDSSGNPVVPTDSSGNPVTRARGANRMSGTPMNYTGATQDFVIPVGYPIYALTHDDKGNNVETEIQLTDIKVGNVINVRYKSDGKTIDKIIISQVTAMTPDEMKTFEEQRANRPTRTDATADNTTETGNS